MTPNLWPYLISGVIGGAGAALIWFVIGSVVFAPRRVRDGPAEFDPPYYEPPPPICWITLEAAVARRGVICESRSELVAEAARLLEASA